MHKTYLREIGCEGISWVEITHNRSHWKAFMNKMMNLFLKNAKNFLIFITVIQCYTGYWFSVAFCHICWFTVS